MDDIAATPMNANADTPAASAAPTLTTELLLLPDGRILVHNLTPAFADVLSELNPTDETIRSRAKRKVGRNDGRRTTAP